MVTCDYGDPVKFLALTVEASRNHNEIAEYFEVVVASCFTCEQHTDVLVNIFDMVVAVCKQMSL